jgi:hypothetical protein
LKYKIRKLGKNVSASFSYPTFPDHLTSPELFLPLMVIILFLLIIRVLRNERKRYNESLMIDGVFRAKLELPVRLLRIRRRRIIVFEIVQLYPAVRGQIEIVALETGHHRQGIVLCETTARIYHLGACCFHRSGIRFRCFGPANAVRGHFGSIRFIAAYQAATSWSDSAAVFIEVIATRIYLLRSCRQP